MGHQGQLLGSSANHKARRFLRLFPLEIATAAHLKCQRRQLAMHLFSDHLQPAIGLLESRRMSDFVSSPKPWVSTHRAAGLSCVRMLRPHLNKPLAAIAATAMSGYVLLHFVLYVPFIYHHLSRLIELHCPIHARIAPNESCRALALPHQSVTCKRWQRQLSSLALQNFDSSPTKIRPRWIQMGSHRLGDASRCVETRPSALHWA